MGVMQRVGCLRSSVGGKGGGPYDGKPVPPDP